MYGFPESHAASFGNIAYASSWFKCHHPDVFCAALLNAQPMGLYAPAQIVRDAREHGVEVRPVCVGDSTWDTRLVDEPDERGWLPLRLGIKVVHGVAEIHAVRLLAVRDERPFASIEDVWRRSGILLACLEKLAKADAFRSMGLDRRQALWAIKGLGEAPLPLLAFAERREAPVSLLPLTAGREVIEDYRATQLTLREHPLVFLRGELARRRIVRCADLKETKDGRRVHVAGVILVRQKPGSAKGVLFITIKAESGVANIILWPDRFEAQQLVVMSLAMFSATGVVQRELRPIGNIDLPRMTIRGDGATHAGSPDRGDPGWRPRIRSDYHPPVQQWLRSRGSHSDSQPRFPPRVSPHRVLAGRRHAGERGATSSDAARMAMRSLPPSHYRRRKRIETATASSDRFCPPR